MRQWWVMVFYKVNAFKNLKRSSRLKHKNILTGHLPTKLYVKIFFSLYLFQFFQHFPYFLFIFIIGNAAASPHETNSLSAPTYLLSIFYFSSAAATNHQFSITRRLFTLHFPNLRENLSAPQITVVFRQKNTWYICFLKKR